MANTKAQSVREVVLDGCLSGNRKYSMSELMDKCNEVLYENGYPEISKKDTILADMQRIQMFWGYDATIEETQSPLDNRIIEYHYKNPEFSIYKTVLSGDDIVHLEQLISLLEGFKGLPTMGWLVPIKEKLNRKKVHFPQEVRSFIELEGSDLPEWGKYLNVIANAIYENFILEVGYRKFGADEDLNYVFRPYYLRQFNGRWYLYGVTVGYDKITTIPLDRIVSLKSTGKTFIPNPDIDFSSYFTDVHGATVYKEDEVEIVRIQVLTRKQLDYIKTKKLHHTQEVEFENEAGGIISLEVCLNYELEKLIMSFGEKIKVLEPTDFANHIRERFQECNKLYN